MLPFDRLSKTILVPLLHLDRSRLSNLSNLYEFISGSCGYRGVYFESWRSA